MIHTHFLVRPQEIPFTSKKKAYLAYRIMGNHLFRGAIPSDTHGGWMVIFSIESSELALSLCAEITAECLTFGYDAVLFPFGTPISETLLDFWNELQKLLLRQKISLILPLAAAGHCLGAKFHLTSEISGGSLRSYLEDLIRVHGNKNLVVEHRLMRRKFNMPSIDSEGEELSDCELKSFLLKPNVQPFYSPELCLNYCTDHTKDGAQFVLFDDERSLSAKTTLCETLGIEHQLYLFSEVKNMQLSL